MVKITIYDRYGQQTIKIDKEVCSLDEAILEMERRRTSCNEIVGLEKGRKQEDYIPPYKKVPKDEHKQFPHRIIPRGELLIDQGSGGRRIIPEKDPDVMEYPPLVKREYED